MSRLDKIAHARRTLNAWKDRRNASLEQDARRVVTLTPRQAKRHRERLARRR